MSTIHEMLIANKLIKNAGKAATTRQRRAPQKSAGRRMATNSGSHVSLEERQQMIADNAYFRAERRNFEPGYEMVDWLAAEAEIDLDLERQAINLQATGRHAIN
ncbi:MAG TPA: DUF2934 domain-containing protein [Methylophilaceae bacterium]|nr:DUF2934 domain-containing protein [Methylophilaceae bacterium]